MAKKRRSNSRTGASEAPEQRAPGERMQGKAPAMSGSASSGARAAVERGDERADGVAESLEPDWTAEQIGSALQELWIEYGPHMTRMRVRRMLLELADDAKHDDRTGTHLPKPYDKSKLILKTLIGDAQDVVQNYTARVSANEPQTSVIPVALSRNSVAKRVEERASEQERLLMSQWHAVSGRQAQRQAAWSQSWGRVGWYLTLPRDASWGLPDRAYFEDLTDDEIEVMRRTGAIVPASEGDDSAVSGADGGAAFAESGESWLERRRAAAQARAISGRSLFTLEEFGPDMVLPRYDRDGTAGRSLKYGFVIEEVPSSDFRPGTELAQAAARQAGVPEEDVEQYGLYLGKDGRIAGGVTRGGEPGSQDGRQHWTLARFVTRDEIYYYVTATPNAGSGRIIWHDVHGAGRVPLIPVPGMYTDSSAPGAEYASLMESVFALTPIINQIETLLSNVATWNALGRFVIEDPGGQLFADDSGDPLIMSTEDMVGLDPQDVSVVKGHVRQLTIDAGMLFQLLDFYTRRMDRSKPAPVTEGQAGATAAAWQVRQLLESSGELLEQAVSNHAEAVKQVQLLWIRWMRMLDERVYAFAAPGSRKNARSVRGLIEFDPADLVESIRVEQSSQSAQQRVVLRQAGIELLQAGRIDEHEFYEHYDLAEDPEEAIVRAWAQRAVDIVMLGNTSGVDPDSVLADVVKAVRGRITMELLDRSPNFALAQAEQMAGQAEQMAAQAQQAGPPLPSTAATAAGGNIAAAMGIREPGLGMATDLPGNPLQGAPGGVPPIPGSGLGPVTAEGAAAALGLAGLA